MDQNLSRGYKTMLSSHFLSLDIANIMFIKLTSARLSRKLLIYLPETVFISYEEQCVLCRKSHEIDT